MVLHGPVFSNTAPLRENERDMKEKARKTVNPFLFDRVLKLEVFRGLEPHGSGHLSRKDYAEGHHIASILRCVGFVYSRTPMDVLSMYNPGPAHMRVFPAPATASRRAPRCTLSLHRPLLL